MLSVFTNDAGVKEMWKGIGATLDKPKKPIPDRLSWHVALHKVIADAVFYELSDSRIREVIEAPGTLLAEESKLTDEEKKQVVDDLIAVTVKLRQSCQAAVDAKN